MNQFCAARRAGKSGCGGVTEHLAGWSLRLLLAGAAIPLVAGLVLAQPAGQPPAQPQAPATGSGPTQPPTQATLSVKDIVGGMGTDEEIKNEDISAAIEAARKGDFPGARKSLEAAREKDPKLPPDELMFARLLVAAQQGPAARVELENCVKANPNDPEAYIILGDVAMSERRLTEAGLLYAKAETLLPTVKDNAARSRNIQMRWLAGMATAAESKEDWAQAKDRLNAWLKLDPKSAMAYTKLGTTLFKMKDYKTAYDNFDKAGKLDTNMPSSAIVMAMLYEQDKDRANAKKWVDYARKVAGKDLKTHLAIAQWAMGTDQLDEAAKAADDALATDKSSLEAKLARGIVARMAGDLKTAERHLKDAHEQSPGNFQASNQLALVLADQDDKDKQQRALEYAVVNARQYQQSPEAATTLGWVQYRLGNKSEAAQTLQRVLGSRNLTPDAAYYVACVIRDIGNRPEDAITLLEAAIGSQQPFVHRKDATSMLDELKKKKAAG